MVSCLAWPQTGQVMVDWRMTSFMVSFVLAHGESDVGIFAIADAVRNECAAGLSKPLAR
jgi:hypothetical protein